MDFLCGQLRTHPDLAIDGGAGENVNLTWIRRPNGDSEVSNVGLTLLRIHEEAAAKTPLRSYFIRDDKNEVRVEYRREPPLCINLDVLLTAAASDYATSLGLLSKAVSFFQANASFSRERNPDLPAVIDRLSVELLNLDYEQMNHIWSAFGGNAIPSAAYRVRMLTIQDAEVEAQGETIRTRGVNP